MEISRRSLLVLLSACSLPMAYAQAARAEGAPEKGISGKWQFAFDTEGGPRTFEADLKVDGKSVTGLWDKKPDVRGTFDDGKLELEFPVVSDEAGPGTLKLSGKLTDVLKGSWSFQSYSGAFKATRITN